MAEWFDTVCVRALACILELDLNLNNGDRLDLGSGMMQTYTAAPFIHEE